jgi:CheY-like chemotaxis protein
MMVLVIDDESVTRRLVTYTLKPLGIEVVGAEDGFEALEIAREQPFDLAIVDLGLPEMDGFEVVAQLRELEHMREVPIIIYTARNEAQDKTRAYEASAVDFLYKPFSTQELRDMVSRYLQIE